MKNNWFFDNNFNGVPDEILEDVVDFFDFPLEDAETDAGEQDWNDQFKHLEEPSLGIFSVPSSELYAETQNEKPNSLNNFAAAELSHIGRRNIVNPSLKDQQALLRKAARPAYTKTMPLQMVSFNGTNLRKCQNYSPVSVFESSSYSSVENFNFELPVIPAKRPRSKRQRLSSIDKLFTIPFISISPAFQKHHLEKQRAGKSSSRVQRKPRKKDISSLSDGIEMKRSALQDSTTPRKCMHCEVTETPQWREGPKGRNTLCNACGVRYRSGRLFPEYRPAASPTFEASLHSNSHRKVLEIRKKDNANMKSNWLFDNNFNGVSDEILEDVEFFDFPQEDVETDAVEHDWNDQFKHLEEPSLGIFSVPSTQLYGETQNEKPNSMNNFAAAELSHIDRRNIVNPSLKDQQALLRKAAGPAYVKAIPIQMVSFNGTNLRKCQTYRPVSVFESSSYSSVENFNFELPGIPEKRPHSKRQRLSSLDKLFTIPFISTSSAFQKHQSEKQRTGKSSSRVQRKSRTGKSSSRVQRKSMKKDISSLSDGIEMKRSSLQDSATPRKDAIEMKRSSLEDSATPRKDAIEMKGSSLQDSATPIKDGIEMKGSSLQDSATPEKDGIEMKGSSLQDSATPEKDAIEMNGSSLQDSATPEKDAIEMKGSSLQDSATATPEKDGIEMKGSSLQDSATPKKDGVEMKRSSLQDSATPGKDAIEMKESSLQDSATPGKDGIEMKRSSLQDAATPKKDGTEMKRSSLQDSATPRKCMHCEITKTPQWREGPKGPRTLCNACGVRYRSGRLFPEYRPAASPTFEASLHSNSHRKVLEIRQKVS